MSPRRRVPDPWPWPADTPLDRARRIAQSYRDALFAHKPAECEHLDRKAAELGQGWIIPQVLVHSADDQLNTEQVAEFCNVQPRTVDAWRSRGLKAIETNEGIRYLVRDVLDFNAERRKRRLM